jgi:hypothetical protein
MKIALISCTKLKENKPCFAADMYMPSSLYKKARKYVSGRYNYWYILSAEYGLLMPTQWIQPYDKTFNNMSKEIKKTYQKEWSQMVFEDLIKLRPNEIDFYAGNEYRKYLIPLLEDQGIKCNVPLKGLGIGEQMKYYNENRG